MGLLVLLQVYAALKSTSTKVLQYIINSNVGVLSSSLVESNYLKINWARRQAVAIGPSLYEYEIHLNGGTCRDARYT